MEKENIAIFIGIPLILIVVIFGSVFMVYSNQPNSVEIVLCDNINGTLEEYGVLNIKMRTCHINDGRLKIDYIPQYLMCIKLMPEWADKVIPQNNGASCIYQKGIDYRELNYKRKRFYLIDNNRLGREI